MRSPPTLAPRPANPPLWATLPSVSLYTYVAVLQTQATAASGERMPFIRRGAAMSVQAAALQLGASLDAAAARGTDLGKARQKLNAALDCVQPLLPAATEEDD